MSNADFETYLGIRGSSSFLIDGAISSLTSAISRKARGASSPIQSLLSETLRAELPLRVEEIQRSLRSDYESVIDQGCEALNGTFFTLSIQFQQALIQGWLSSVNEAKSSLNNRGPLMALGIAYRHMRQQNQELGNTIRHKLLSQTEGRDYVSEVWALRSLASSVLVEEGTRFRVIMCSPNTYSPRSASDDN